MLSKKVLITKLLALFFMIGFSLPADAQRDGRSQTEPVIQKESPIEEDAPATKETPSEEAEIKEDTKVEKEEIKEEAEEEVYTRPEFDINEVKGSFSKGTHNGFAIAITDVNINTVKDQWKKLLKKSKGKVKVKGNEAYAEQVLLSDINSNKMDVYATYGVQNGHVNLVTFFDLGGNYLTSEEFPQKAKAVEQYLNDFALYLAEEEVKKELEVAEKELKNRKNHLKKLEKEKANLHKDIEKWQESILNAENRIEENIIEQGTARESITDQQGVIKKVQLKLQVFK